MAQKVNELQTLENEVKQLTKVRNENEDKPIDKKDVQREGDKLKKIESSIQNLSKDLKDSEVLRSELSQEILILQRTEDIMRKKSKFIQDQLEQHSSKEQISALRETRSKMQLAHEQTQKVNEIKGQALEEISSIVTKMTKKLGQRQENLQPMVCVSDRSNFS